MDKYQIEAEKFAKAVDIANEADARSHARGKMTKDKLEIRRKINLMRKEQALNPSKKSRNLDSLNETIHSFLKYYYRSKREDADYFWEKIKEYGLGYERLDWRDKSFWEAATTWLPKQHSTQENYPMDKYQIEAEKLAKAIDIAIEATSQSHAKGKINNEEFNIAMNIQSMRKDKTLYPEKSFRNIRSLNETKNDLLTYYNEGSGEDVEYFWKKVKEYDLGYERVDMMAKIFKRKKISNMNEYDFVIDTIVPAQQLGRITKEQAGLLDKYITQYENKRKKQ